MSHIETIIVLLLLFMAVPDICRKFGRLSLTYAVFVVFGIALGTFTDQRVQNTFIAAGEVGFLLLLFEVGLEIELPPVRKLLKPAAFALGWALIQYPLILAFTEFTGLTFFQGIVAATSLTGCSVGMAYPAWKNFATDSPQKKEFVLQIMLVLETLAIILLTTESVALEKGLSWLLALKLGAVIGVVLLVAAFADTLTRLFQVLLEKTIHWRTHVLVLAVLIICAVGERFGLSGAKTAFFLGLFMSRINHDNKPLEDYIAPISHQFLIPLFFVALGMQVQWQSIFSQTGLMALAATGVLLGFRKVLGMRWFRTGQRKREFLLFCPNLTVVALASSVLLKEPNTTEGVLWLLLTGLFMTVAALFALPAVKQEVPDPEI